MATVTTEFGALRFEDLTFGAGVPSGTPTSIRFTFSPGNYYEYTGNFSYNAFGQVIAGTVNAITEVVNNRAHYSITDITADAPTFFAQPDLVSAAATLLSGNDDIAGRNLADSLYGYTGNDRMVGNGGGDALYGMEGKDTLRGGAGDDILVGGFGADRLIGGADADTFVYTSLFDSEATSKGRDRIIDFSSAEGDKIDLSQIDAIDVISSAVGDNDAFTLVDAFHNVAGELKVSSTANGFLVLGDVDGDSVADFGIFVESAAPLSSSDFVL